MAKHYQDLSYLEKRVLQLIAFTRTYINKTDLLKVLNCSDLRGFLGKQINHAILSTVLQTLTSKSLLQPNLSLKNKILHQVALDAATGEHSKDNASSLLQNMRTNPSLMNGLMVAVYINNAEVFNKIIDDDDLHTQSIINALAYDFDNISLKKLVPEIKYWAIAAKISTILSTKDKITDLEDIREWIDTQFPVTVIRNNVIIDLLLNFFLLTDNLEQIKRLSQMTRNNYIKNQSILGIIAFLENQPSLIYFDQALKALKDKSRKRNVCLSGICGVCHILALLKDNSIDNIQELLKIYISLYNTYNKELERSRYSDKPLETQQYFTPSHFISYSILKIFTDFLRFSIDAKTIDNEIWQVISRAKDTADALDSLILFLVLYWTKSKAFPEYKEDLCKRYNNILPVLVAVLRNETTNFTEIIKNKPEWERAIENLDNYFNTGTKSYDKRLVWMLYPRSTEGMIVPFEQKRTGNNWNKGRPASLKRLYDTKHQLNCQYDKAVVNCIKSEYDYYRSNFRIDNNKGLLALVNHPLVFDGNTGEHLELSKAGPELVVQETKDNLVIKLSEDTALPTAQLRKESENKYQVIEITPSIIELMKIIGTGINVPISQRGRLLSLVQKAAANITVRTEFTEGLESEPGDASITVQLTFIEDILRVKLFVRPFGKGPYYKPGKGNNIISAQVDNSYKSVSRNLPLERSNADHLLQQCSMLQEDSDYEWKITELETSLETLQQLSEYKNNNQLTIEWPKGQSLFIDQEISFKNVELSISTNNQWFEFDGNVAINDNQVIEMRQFLQNLEQAKGRFIELSDKRFIALTTSFAKRMQELNTAARTSDKGLVIHKLGSPLLQDLAEGAKQVKTDHNWQSHINKLSASYDPKVPNNLQAELRPYQVDGFKWLSRLSNLGFGGCLADDMGLGKTIQTIALLLEQATHGPCLVMAPSSVCYVWQEECQKFAPSLNCIVLGNNREEHKSLI